MAQSICDSTLKDVSPGSSGAWMETSIKRLEESLIQQNFRMNIANMENLQEPW